jgi:hypothetical protein
MAREALGIDHPRSAVTRVIFRAWARAIESRDQAEVEAWLSGREKTGLCVAL